MLLCLLVYTRDGDLNAGHHALVPSAVSTESPFVVLMELCQGMEIVYERNKGDKNMCGYVID